MKITKKTAACTILAAGLAATAIAQGASLTADFSKKTSVSDNLYGIFYEDINYAADGGLTVIIRKQNASRRRYACNLQV